MITRTAMAAPNKPQAAIENGKVDEDENIDSAWAKGKLENSINHVVAFLNGEGISSARSEKDMAKSKDKGGIIRQALLDEFRLFNEEIRPLIGESVYRDLVDQCCRWIKKESTGCKEPADQKYWESLYASASDELKNLKKRG